MAKQKTALPNLINNEKDFTVFCKEMNRQLGCAFSHCQRSCLGDAVVKVQRSLSQGMTMSVAIARWVYGPFPHKEGEEMLCDILGVKDMDEARAILKEEKE